MTFEEIMEVEYKNPTGIFAVECLSEQTLCDFVNGFLSNDHDFIFEAISKPYTFIHGEDKVFIYYTLSKDSDISASMDTIKSFIQNITRALKEGTRIICFSDGALPTKMNYVSSTFLRVEKGTSNLNLNITLLRSKSFSSGINFKVGLTKMNEIFSSSKLQLQNNQGNLVSMVTAIDGEPLDSALDLLIVATLFGSRFKGSFYHPIVIETNGRKHIDVGVEFSTSEDDLPAIRFTEGSEVGFFTPDSWDAWYNVDSFTKTLDRNIHYDIKYNLEYSERELKHGTLVMVFSGGHDYFILKTEDGEKLLKSDDCFTNEVLPFFKDVVLTDEEKELVLFSIKEYKDQFYRPETDF